MMTWFTATAWLVAREAEHQNEPQAGRATNVDAPRGGRLVSNWKDTLRCISLADPEALRPEGTIRGPSFSDANIRTL